MQRKYKIEQKTGLDIGTREQKWFSKFVLYDNFL